MKISKTLSFETIEDCNFAREYWGESVVDWDNVAKTVTIEADEDEIQEYFNNQFEIHGWE